MNDVSSSILEFRVQACVSGVNNDAWMLLIIRWGRVSGCSSITRRPLIGIPFVPHIEDFVCKKYKCQIIMHLLSNTWLGINRCHIVYVMLHELISSGWTCVYADVATNACCFLTELHGQRLHALGTAILFMYRTKVHRHARLINSAFWRAPMAPMQN